MTTNFDTSKQVTNFVGFWLKLIPPDIFDAVYAFSNEEMNILGLPPSSLQKKGLLVRLSSYFYWMTKEVLSRFKFKGFSDDARFTDAIVFFYASLNEKRALKSVANGLENSALVSVDMDDSNAISLVYPYFLGLLYSPWVFINYLKSVGYRRKSFGYALDQYLLASGYIVYLRFLLSFNRPALVVVSNDHSMFARSFALVCRELNIPVAYIQHASVSAKFPRLIFDYAFLDGLDALEKYERKGLGNCEIFLSGVSKLDDAIQKIQRGEFERCYIAICPNSMDDLVAVTDTAKYIKENVAGEFRVCIRPHPGDTRRFAEWKGRAEKYGVEYRSSETECSSDLMSKSSFVIAADSNILLEAALLKSIPISMPFTGEILDHYGFVRRGVAIYAKDKFQLISIIQGGVNAMNFYQAAKYFSHIVATGYEGASSKLIADTLNELARSKVTPSKWSLHSSGVYEVV